MVWRGIWRIVVVVFAMLVAGFVTSSVLFTVGLEQLTQIWYGSGPADIDRTLVVLEGGFRLASAVTLIPSLLLVIVGEIGRIRHALYYLLGGGLALAAIPLFAHVAQHGIEYGSTARHAILVYEVFATAGFAGGGVYWLLAGRRA